MREFEFQITDARGLHAQVASELAKYIRQTKSQAYFTKGKKSVNIERTMEVLSLGAGPGDWVRVTVVGDDEAVSFEYLKTYFEKQL